MTTTPQPAATSGASGERPWTPGPYIVDRHDGERLLIVDADDICLAEVDTRHFVESEEGQAVAQLFAAAPAMYEALLDLVNRAENFAHSHAMIANGKGHVEGTQLRYSIDRARAALSAAQQEAGDAERPQGGEVSRG